MKPILVILTVAVSFSAMAFKGDGDVSLTKQFARFKGDQPSPFGNIETTANGRSVIRNVQITFKCDVNRVVLTDQDAEIYYEIDKQLCVESFRPFQSRPCVNLMGDVEAGEVGNFFRRKFEIVSLRNLTVIGEICGLREMRPGKSY